MAGGRQHQSVSPLSQAQLQRRLARNPQLPIHQLLSQAIEQQRLVRMVAGIQWPITGTLARRVFYPPRSGYALNSETAPALPNSTALARLNRLWPAPLRR